MKSTSCTEQKCYAFDIAPRCGARTKRNNGNPCRSPAVKGKQRCRIHGGSKGSGGQRGNENALKHGHSTASAITFKRNIRNALKQAQSIVEVFDSLVEQEIGS